MPTSNLQRKFSAALSLHFGAYTIRENSRPEWCLGDDFERLELDFYLPDLNVAVEIQGAQHYVYVPHFHGSYDGFKAARQRDAAKIRRCKDYGVLLIEVDDAISFDEAIDQIRQIETVLNIKQRKNFSPEQWRHKICAFERNVRKVWNARFTTPKKLLTGKAGAYKSKLLHIIGVYGLGVFDYAPQPISESLFWHTQKITFWTRKDVAQGGRP